MGILAWLFGRPKTNKNGLELAWAGDGTYELDVVGESFYQENLSKLCGGRCEAGYALECVAQLVTEPQNKHDRKAVGVWIKGVKVAHISRDDLPEYHDALRSFRLGSTPVLCAATIVGGWDRGSDDRGHFGVKLDMRWPPELAK